MARTVPQTPSSPTRPPRAASPLTSARKSLLSRIPEPIGRIWNGIIYAATLLLLVGSHFAVFQPTGANRSYPTWFLALEYFLMVDGMVLLISFGMLDRRRLRRRFPVLDRYRGREFVTLWLKALGIMGVVMILVIAIGNASGIVA